jgi:hypothetical protein
MTDDPERWPEHSDPLVGSLMVSGWEQAEAEEYVAYLDAQPQREPKQEVDTDPIPFSLGGE